MFGQSEEGFECPDFIKRNSGKAGGLPPEERAAVLFEAFFHDANHLYFCKDGIP